MNIFLGGVVVSDFIKDEKKVSTIDFKPFKHPFRGRLSPQLSRASPLQTRRGVMGPSDPSDSNPTSKQGFIRSKQQLQQFAPPPFPPLPTSILLNFILRRGDQTVHKHEGTGKERGAEKKIRESGWW